MKRIKILLTEEQYKELQSAVDYWKTVVFENRYYKDINQEHREKYVKQLLKKFK